MQFLDVHRFEQVVGSREFEGLHGVLIVGGGKNHVEEEVLLLFQHLKAVAVGQFDIEEYQPRPDASVLKKHGVDPDVPYVLFVGRITRQKGIIHLVNALRHLDSGTQVVLCAGAPDTDEIAREMREAVARARETARSPIVWIDEMLPRSEIVTLYTHAAVFVCPSVYEPFGIINLEAMACETPVVASEVGGIPEVVVPEETGLLVPLETAEHQAEPKDPDAFAGGLADAINRLMRDEKLRKSMGAKARRRVEEQFSWRSIAGRTLEYYQDLLNRDR